MTALDVLHRLKVLERAEDALQGCGIGGIYDDFGGLADAIEQMAHYVKEVERERDEWQVRAESAKRQRNEARGALRSLETWLERVRITWEKWGSDAEECIEQQDESQTRAKLAKRAIASADLARQGRAEQADRARFLSAELTDVRNELQTARDALREVEAELKQCNTERSAWKRWAEEAEVERERKRLAWKDWDSELCYTRTMDVAVRRGIRQYLADAADYAKDARNLFRRKTVDVTQAVRKIDAARDMLHRASRGVENVRVDP